MTAGAGWAWALPAQHVARPDLAARVACADRPVALVAGGGYGKTTLAGEVAGAHPGPVLLVRIPPTGASAPALWRLWARAARRIGLTDLALVLGADATADSAEVTDGVHRVLAATDPPVLAVVDEAHLLDTDAGDWLADLLDPAPAGLRVVMLGRGLPPALAAHPGISVLGPADLRFDAADTARYAAATGYPGHAGADLQRETDGWPALVALAVHEEAGSTPSSLGSLVQRHLGTLAVADRDALVQSAHLPLLHPDVDRALGVAGLVDRVARSGLPVTRHPDHTWGLAGPVAEHLRRQGVLEPAAARAVAAVYLTRGEPGAAVRLLAAAGLPQDAAAELSRWHPSTVETEEPAGITALVAALPDSAVRRHPRVLVVAARAYHRLGDFTQQLAALEQAAGIALDGSPLQREARADWAWASAGAVDAAPVVTAARTVLAEAPAGEVAVRGRALLALGRALAQQSDAADRREARRATEAAIHLFDEQGDPTSAAEALLDLGYHQHFQEGRYDEAEDALRRALQRVPGRGRLRARLTVFLAEVLLGRGNHAAARVVLDEAAYLARTVGSRHTAAYVPWLRMELASRDGDRDAVLARVSEVHRLSGPWWEHVGGGALFLFEATVATARVDPDAASGLLQELRAHPAVIEVLVTVAEAAVAVRRGDPQRTLEALADTSQLPSRLLWWAAALRAAAYRALGQEESARTELAQVAAHALRLGLPHLPSIVEPGLLLEPGSAPATPIEVQLLGTFRVRRGDAPVELPPGHLATLVQLVAVTGGVRVEEALDTLWPDSDLGRKRFRNVLHRLGAICPGLVERSGDRLLLGPAVRSDVEDFEIAVQAVARAAPADSVGLARAALVRYPGDLLGDRPAESWLIARRERLRLHLLDLLDRLVDAAIGDDDLDEALRLLTRAIDADPLDEQRYLTAATLLADRSRHAAARVLLDRAATMRAGLRLPPTRAHQAVRARLDASG